MKATRTLLIPTDLDPAMLGCITVLAKRLYPQKIEVILVNLMKLTDNPTDLEKLSRRSAEYQKISSGFYDACALLKRSNPDSIHDIRIEFFYGSTVAVFREYLETNNVDDIVMLDRYEYRKLNKNSISPELMVQRLGMQVMSIDHEPDLQGRVKKILQAMADANA